MRDKHIIIALGAACAAALIVAFTISRSHAGYPMISGLANQRIEVNQQTDVMKFNVYDDSTSVDDLTFTYTSNLPSLVPANDNHIILGGSGSDRTVQVIPARDQSGTALITIIVRDSDGDTNQDSFEVEVNRPTRMP
jgi:hypothetical protein